MSAATNERTGRRKLRSACPTAEHLSLLFMQEHSLYRDPFKTIFRDGSVALSWRRSNRQRVVLLFTTDGDIVFDSRSYLTGWIEKFRTTVDSIWGIQPIAQSIQVEHLMRHLT